MSCIDIYRYVNACKLFICCRRMRDTVKNAAVDSGTNAETTEVSSLHMCTLHSSTRTC